MNCVCLIGRICRDIEMRGEVARYTLAVDRKFKKEGQPEADFLNIVAFGKSAEFAQKYFHKGMKVSVVGRIQTDSYTNKEGQKIYTTDIIVEEQGFCESKNASSGSAQETTSNDNDFMDMSNVNVGEMPF